MSEFRLYTTEEKVQNACHRLNAEAYEKQVLAVKGWKLKQFNPCAKAEQLMAAIRKGDHFGTCHMRAAQTHCECHPSLTEAQLMAYEYDETYKLANFAGDHKTLYPRLYGRTA
ncbi:MAG: hypothetical protein WC710_14120 [Gallionella sp.]|jgi:hypothetical protein